MQAHSTRVIYGSSLRHLPNVDGHHYDLARQISSYFVNFIKTGNPNGNDYNENKLPEWKPYCDSDRYEMNFTKDGAAGGSTETERMRFLLDSAE